MDIVVDDRDRFVLRQNIAPNETRPPVYRPVTTLSVRCPTYCLAAVMTRLSTPKICPAASVASVPDDGVRPVPSCVPFVAPPRSTSGAKPVSDHQILKLCYF